MANIFITDGEHL